MSPGRGTRLAEIGAVIIDFRLHRTDCAGRLRPAIVRPPMAPDRAPRINEGARQFSSGSEEGNAAPVRERIDCFDRPTTE
jgi:hypothetical protein